ncbi:Ubiquitin-like-specific protease 2 [Termitomyces sp. J132]|nr:Ubiquitin-like-specific protease 2 [Termitomyces sp. J132]
MDKTSSSKDKYTPHEDVCIEVVDTDDDQNMPSVKDIQLVNKKQDRDIEAAPSDFSAPRSYLSKYKPAPARFRPYDGDCDEPEYLSSSTQASGSRHIKDGDATRALELQIGLSSDPISDSSPPPRGHVKQMVQHYEIIQRPEKNNFLDLRKVSSRKGGIKNSMKTKNPTRHDAKVLPVDETMFPTSFVNSSPMTNKLWIEKWFFGTELREYPNECFISWERNTLTVWEDGRRIIWFELINELSSVEYCQVDPFILKFKTKESPTEFDQRNHNRFRMGHSRHLGEVVIRIEKRSDVEKNYRMFIAWINDHKQYCTVLRESAGRSVWEDASRAAEMAAQSLRRQSDATETGEDSYKPPAPLEDDHDLTLPPVGELLRESPSRAPTSVTSSRPASRTMTIRNSREGLRRSTRRRRSPSVDPEEVILCYPQGVPGAVYIKNSDHRRLRPGEFLNDTLIEFGLKLWLNRLQESNPELASQVHVFSSFFYHLLDNKNKKYVIVPINDDSEQHWYLAIIYHPEHILTPMSAVQGEKTPTIDGVLRSVFASRPKEERSVSEGLLICDSSCSVEVETLDSEQLSRGVSTIHNNASETWMSDVTALSDSGMTPTGRTSDMEVEDEELLLMVPDHTNSAPVDHIVYDVDMHDVPMVSLMRTNGETTFQSDNNVEPHSVSVAPASFYGMSAKVKGKQKAIPNQAVTRKDDRTYIFTFDSLGTERLPAIDRLSRYLKQEAQDKLMRSDTSDAVGFKAQVPVQPNFYDCGLYLLHFAETFMSDPDHYSRIIRVRYRTRKDDWKYEQTVDMRERFRADIEKLSAEWKKDRAQKEEVKRKEAAEGGPSIQTIESSDDEIDIVETTPAPASGKAKKKGGRRKSPKKSTSVMRLR